MEREQPRVSSLHGAQLMSDDDRKKLIESICRTSDHLAEVARRYDRLRWMAEKDCSGAFLALASTAGKMIEGNLAQVGDLLEMLYFAQTKES